MHTSTLPAPTTLRLACPYGYFELACAHDPPAPLRWGCPAAERYADARQGARLRYETLAAGHGEGGLELELRPADPSRAADLASTHVCLAQPGRWLAATSGALAIDDGEHRTVVAWEPGPLAITWYARADVSLYEGPACARPMGPHHVLVLEPLAPNAVRPCADMPGDAATYAAWHAIQRATDAAEVEDALLAPDPEGWRRLVLLHRLARLGATDAVRRIAARAPADLLAFAARSILAGTSSVDPPPSLDALPDPEILDSEPVPNGAGLPDEASES